MTAIVAGFVAIGVTTAEVAVVAGFVEEGAAAGVVWGVCWLNFSRMTFLEALALWT